MNSSDKYGIPKLSNLSRISHENGILSQMRVQLIESPKVCSVIWVYSLCLGSFVKIFRVNKEVQSLLTIGDGPDKTA